jgi:hypothetical protein
MMPVIIGTRDDLTEQALRGEVAHGRKALSESLVRNPDARLRATRVSCGKFPKSPTMCAAGPITREWMMRRPRLVNQRPPGSVSSPPAASSVTRGYKNRMSAQRCGLLAANFFEDKTVRLFLPAVITPKPPHG